MFTLAFWKATAERCVKTFAQALAAVLVGVYGLTDVDWPTSLGAAGLATLLSVLTSVASSRVGGPGPSVSDSEVLPPTDPGDHNPGGPFRGYGNNV